MLLKVGTGSFRRLEHAAVLEMDCTALLTFIAGSKIFETDLKLGNCDVSVTVGEKDQPAADAPALLLEGSGTLGKLWEKLTRDFVKRPGPQAAGNSDLFLHVRVSARLGLGL